MKNKIITTLSILSTVIGLILFTGCAQNSLESSCSVSNIETSTQSEYLTTQEVTETITTTTTTQIVNEEVVETTTTTTQIIIEELVQTVETETTTIQTTAQSTTTTQVPIQTSVEITDYWVEEPNVEMISAAYIVQPGEILDEIAWRNGLTVDAIARFNGIDQNYIVSGQTIYLPGITEVVYGNYIENPGSYENSNDNSYENSYESSDGLVNWYSTTLYTAGADANSWYNIELAASMLNGYQLPAGTSFSWFTVMGPCDTYQGYIDASVYIQDYEGNTIVSSAPGGGICFVSTSIMQGARGAGCIITEKHNHSSSVSYATPGNEASVNWGSWDLKFYNPSYTTDLVFYVETNEWARSCTITVCPL